MHLMTHNGLRVDRQTDYRQMMAQIQAVPFNEVSNEDRQRLKRLLDLQHQERELRRFAPIDYGDDDYEHTN